MKRRKIIVTLVIFALILIPLLLATLGPVPLLQFKFHAKPSEWRVSHFVEGASFEPMERIPGRDVFQLGPVALAVRKRISPLDF